MKRTIAIWSILAILPIFTFAQQEYRTPSGLVVIQDDNLGKNFIQWILPNGNIFFQKVEAAELTIQDTVRMWADNFDVSYNQMDKTIQCESGYDNSVRGKAGEIGIAQFMPATWNKFEKEYGEDLDIHSADNQVELMAWAFSQGVNYKKQWTCWRQYFVN